VAVHLVSIDFHHIYDNSGLMKIKKYKMIKIYGSDFCIMRFLPIIIQVYFSCTILGEAKTAFDFHHWCHCKLDK